MKCSFFIENEIIYLNSDIFYILFVIIKYALFDLVLQKSNGMSTAALVGIIIGSVIGCAVLAVIVRVVTVIVRRNCHKGV
jgi:hypothetical protein